MGFGTQIIHLNTTPPNEINTNKMKWDQRNNWWTIAKWLPKPILIHMIEGVLGMAPADGQPSAITNCTVRKFIRCPFDFYSFVSQIDLNAGKEKKKENVNLIYTLCVWLKWIERSEPILMWYLMPFKHLCVRTPNAYACNFLFRFQSKHIILWRKYSVCIRKFHGAQTIVFLLRTDWVNIRQNWPNCLNNSHIVLRGIQNRKKKKERNKNERQWYGREFVGMVDIVDAVLTLSYIMHYEGHLDFLFRFLKSLNVNFDIRSFCILLFLDFFFFCQGKYTPIHMLTFRDVQKTIQGNPHYQPSVLTLPYVRTYANKHGYRHPLNYFCCDMTYCLNKSAPTVK